MRIPDGDLVPQRRHRYYGGYGRRRRLRTRRFAIFALLVLVVAGVALWIGRDDTPSAGAAHPCVTPSASPQAAALVLPAPAQVRLTLLNGTPRNQLATTVGNALKARGFVVASTGNASAALAGPSLVTYGPGSLAGATLVGIHVRGAHLVSNPRAAAGSVSVVLGGDFTHLATVPEAQAAVLAATAPSAAPRPTCVA